MPACSPIVLTSLPDGRLCCTGVHNLDGVSWCQNQGPRFDAARHGYEAMPTSMGPGVLVRVAADILLLNHELLAALVVELGGDGNTNTVNELTVVPSEDVESCIRGLHINGALVPPICNVAPGTGVAIAHDCCCRGPTSPWSSSSSLCTCA